MTSSGRELLEILGDAGELGESSIKALRKFMEKWQVSAFDAIMECQVISEQKMADVLARLLDLPRVTVLNPRDIDDSVFAMVPFRLAAQWEAMPIGLGASVNELRVMVADPLNMDLLAKMEQLTHKRIHFLVAERSYVRQSIEDLYPLHLQMES